MLATGANRENLSNSLAKRMGIVMQRTVDFPGNSGRAKAFPGMTFRFESRHILMFNRYFFGAVSIFAGILISGNSFAEPSPPNNTVPTTQEAPFVNLWPEGKVPHATGNKKSDTPALQIFKAPAGIATGAAFIVCPGGGYGGLAQHEAGIVGQWFAEHGITAFVLRYRLAPQYHYPAEIEDGQRAVRYVRAHAADWGIDAQRIGIMGFSAGGHLASSVATHYTAGNPASEDPVDRVSSRPDLHILIYPVITLSGPDTHVGSRNNLLGNEPKVELMELFSNEKQVTKDTSPAFIVYSITDKVVPVSNADHYVEALKAAAVPCEYIRLETGPHGFGLTREWTPQCIEWLRKNKF